MIPVHSRVGVCVEKRNVVSIACADVELVYDKFSSPSFLLLKTHAPARLASPRRLSSPTTVDRRGLLGGGSFACEQPGASPRRAHTHARARVWCEVEEAKHEQYKESEFENEPALTSGSVMVASKKVALRTTQAAMKRSPSSHPILSPLVCLGSRPLFAINCPLHLL